MEGSQDQLFEGKVVAWLRTRCIGFKREQEGLVAVVEHLVQPEQGPPERVYQVQRLYQPTPLLRYRPSVDIPAPTGPGGGEFLEATAA